MRVLVVGGGITGLVAARSLTGAGMAVVLAEASPRLGGKIATERLDGFLVEHGPDSFLAARPAAVALARELGLGDELVGTREPRAVFIRHRGRLVPMPEGLGLVLPTRALPFVRSPLFSWPEKLRMGLDLVRPRVLGPDDVAVGRFLRRRLGEALVDRLAGPLVGGVYGTPIDELSLDAVVPQLRAAERDHRSLLLAGLAEGRAMRRAAAARAAAAREAAGAGPGAARPLGVFVSLREGVGALVDGLARSLEAAGVEVRTGRPVTGLARAGAGVSASLAGSPPEAFDAVVIATPAPAAADLLAPALPSAAQALRAIPHGTSILVTLAYARAAVDQPLTGHGYLVPPGEGGAISACTWSSEKWPGRAPGQAVLLRLFVRDDERWTSLPDEELVAAARRDAEATLGIRAEPGFVRVSRAVGSMPRYTVGHQARVEAIDRAMEAWPAITLAGASYRGVGLPDCVSQGIAAAARVRERRGSTAVTAA